MGDYGELYEDAVATYGAALADWRGDMRLTPTGAVTCFNSFISPSGEAFACSTDAAVWARGSIASPTMSRPHMSLRSRRASSRLIGLEALEAEPGLVDGEAEAHRRDTVARLLRLIRRLKPLDRQIILLYLEGERAASIAEVTGLKPGNVATKIHRIKRLLRKQFDEGQ